MSDVFERISKMRDSLREEATALGVRSRAMSLVHRLQSSTSFAMAAEAVREADRELQWAQVAIRDAESQGMDNS